MVTETVRRSRWWIWLAGVLVAGWLLAGAVIGAWSPDEFVVLRQFDRPGLFGALAFVSLALTAWLAIRHQLARKVVAGLLSLFAAVWAMAGALSLPFRTADLDEHERHLSPDGTHQLVVYLGWSGIDPIWELRLRSGTGLLTREWDLGCIDAEIESIIGVEWPGPDTLRLYLFQRGSIDIVIDGAPSRTLAVGCRG